MFNLRLQTILAFIAAVILLQGCWQGVEDAVSHHPNDQPDDMYFVLHSPGIGLRLDTGDGPMTISRKYDLDNNGSKDLLVTLNYAADTCSQGQDFYFSSEITSLKSNMYFAQSYDQGIHPMQMAYGDSINLDDLDADPFPNATGVTDYWGKDYLVYLYDCSPANYVHEFSNAAYLPVKFIQEDGAHLGWVQFSQYEAEIADTAPLRKTMVLEILGWGYNRAPRNDIFAGQTR